MRLRSWTDLDSGMVRISGQFDPESGLGLLGEIDGQVDRLFHAATPPGCPTDPVERQQFLRGHALLALLGLDPGSGSGSGPGSGSGRGGRPRFVVTIDHTTLTTGRRHPGSRIDVGVDGVELPVEVLVDHARHADVVPVVMRDGVAVAVGRPTSADRLGDAVASLHRGGGAPLDLGRTTRFASRPQRDALRAMYRWCAIPGCRVPVERCEPHHSVEWERGGRTDLALLVPLCKHDHDRVHQRGWRLSVAPDRSITISSGATTVMTTGPPSAQWR